MSEQTQTIPAQQRDDYKVGPGCPPKEHQFQPGTSGNPKGSPKRRTNLWKFINRFMEMTDAELAKVDRPAMTQAQQIALRIVETAKEGQDCGAERLARYCVDRDLGRPTELHVVDKADSWKAYQEWLEQGRDPEVSHRIAEHGQDGTA